jgi:bifunctional DNA-binding transcriptional regulator/antitoxin component of YhaV-PrlF toxin-antitoxin module
LHLLTEIAMLAVAEITAMGQTIIPQNVRAALHVGAGDLIAWDVDSNGIATVRRAEPVDMAYLHALEGTLGEWASPADEVAYRGL